MGEKIILIPLFFTVLLIIQSFTGLKGFYSELWNSQEEAQKEAYSYIESIKKETQSNKEMIIVDWEKVGNAPREIEVEFEKDMIEKKYKAESNHNNIVVYKKIAH